MGFRSDIATDYEAILEAEFASRIVFHLSASDWDTRGIYDETYEEVQLEEHGQPIAALMTRVLIYYRNRPADIARGDLVTLYPDPDLSVSEAYQVHDLQEESEGHATVILRREP